MPRSCRNLTETSQLHSRSGSQRVIHLDSTVTRVAGTAWTEDAGVASFDAEPLSIDDLPTFSAAERAIVQDVWKRVSEDFAIFDVDVTTEDPGEAAINRSDGDEQRYGTRALITDTHTIADDCGCPGMAFVGAFGGPGGVYFLPALVFSRGPRYSPKSIAEVVSHEVGHNLGGRRGPQPSHPGGKAAVLRVAPQGLAGTVDHCGMEVLYDPDGRYSPSRGPALAQPPSRALDRSDLRTHDLH